MINFKLAILCLLFIQAAVARKVPGCINNMFTCDDISHTTAFCCTAEDQCDGHASGLIFQQDDPVCTKHCRQKMKKKRKNACVSMQTKGCWQTYRFFDKASLSDARATINRGLYHHEWMSNWAHIIKWSKSTVPKWMYSSSWAAHHALMDILAIENSNFMNEIMGLQYYYDEWTKANGGDKAAPLFGYETEAAKILKRFWLAGSEEEINLPDKMRKKFGPTGKESKISQYDICLPKAKDPANYNFFVAGWEEVKKVVRLQIGDIEGSASFKKWAKSMPEDYQAYERFRSTVRPQIGQKAHIEYDNHIPRFYSEESDETDNDNQNVLPYYGGYESGSVRDNSDSYNPLMILMSLEIFTIFVVMLCMVGVGCLVCGGIAYYAYVQSQMREKEANIV